MTDWTAIGGGPRAVRVWGVAALVQAISDSLSVRFADCGVRGEISGFSRAASGHGYFTLKDERGGASLRCAIFRRALSQLDFQPRDGMVVEARGTLSVYEARGELQLVVDALEPAGAGALYEQFLRLKARLEGQGLFDAARKRPLRRFPQRIAVVTSPAAAALHDVLTALRRRAPHVEVVLSPCPVQGAEAPDQIVSALGRVAEAHHRGIRFDTVILCRGGGSLEDLWAFNDERVVRAVVASPVPVVCGVGHETDVSLADFAADLRAPTPTAAAELAAAAQDQALAELDAQERRLRQRSRQRLDLLMQSLDRASIRLARPAQLLGRHVHALEQLQRRALSACRHRLGMAAHLLPGLGQRLQRAGLHEGARRRHALDALEHRLRALDPQRVLERGYAWLSTEEGTPLTRSDQAHVGQRLDAVLADGVLRVEVSSAATRRPDTTV